MRWNTHIFPSTMDGFRLPPPPVKSLYKGKKKTGNLSCQASCLPLLRTLSFCLSPSIKFHSFFSGSSLVFSGNSLAVVVCRIKYLMKTNVSMKKENFYFFSASPSRRSYFSKNGKRGKKWKLKLPVTPKTVEKSCSWFGDQCTSTFVIYSFFPLF